MQARLLGKIGTALQLALVLLTLIGPDLDHLAPGPARAALWWLGFAAAAVSLAACIDYAFAGWRILHQPRPTIGDA
ncbi:MAG: hypothetical protein AVDCRST_MAG54-2696 [uncultured Actinomycetospora sp.]|uniref:Uncharacterized protein n=1 Tax=uncultured Actinomycetospora sp. TaxID=1135996 RepID=A0A6J4J2V1_9PSEU|nr:MAG: hypothetical protein AVDCRST_MAG54-2696 [uncultured Actinomycetospora sp.]